MLQMPELLSLPSDMKDLCVNEEQNAIFNQIFLCIQRIIELRCPLGMLTEEGEKGHFVVTLSEWIVRFVRSVEVDLQLQERLSNRIVNMVKESISLQFELLRAIESRADKVSSLTTVRLNPSTCILCYHLFLYVHMRIHKHNIDLMFFLCPRLSCCVLLFLKERPLKRLFMLIFYVMVKV